MVGGSLFMNAVHAGGATLLPIDSEHSAIFQCLPEDRSGWAARIDHILLTSSGGPFRRRDPTTLSTITPDEACAHPNFAMGRKISVDSATMMNKALEVIEARWLFELAPAQIQVVIHPQQIVHSMVVCRDNSVLAQLGTPDMRVPIAYGLSFPERIESGAGRLDFSALAALTFEAPDFKRYPGLALAWETLHAAEGSTTVLNAANEDGGRGLPRGADPLRPDPRRHRRSVGARRPRRRRRRQPRCTARHRPPRARAGVGVRERLATMNALITPLAFLLTISVLIVFHEYGHYRVARACGVKVLRFSVGFGRVIWRRQASPDSTEFVLSLLPFGGYVQMLGRGETVRPDQVHESFEHKALWQRAAIVAAGPGANFLLAIVLYAAAHWIGMDEPRAVMGTPAAAGIAEHAGLRAGDWAREASTDGNDWRPIRSLADLQWEVQRAALQGQSLQLMVTDRYDHGRHTVVLPLDTLGSEVDAKTLQRIGLGGPFSEPVVGGVVVNDAGWKSGLRNGDRVLSIDGVAVADAAAERDAIRASGRGGTARPMQWRIDRAGQTLDLTVTPALLTENGQKFGRLGLFPGQAPEMVKVRYGVFEGLEQAVVQTWQMSVLNLKMLGKMVIGQASLKNLSGPLTIADYAGQSVRLGVAYYLGFLAVVSIGLGVLNLLPLPVLDGGHLMYYLFEGVTGRPVSELWLDRLQRGGVAIMLMMMSLALYNDVARLLGLQ